MVSCTGSIPEPSNITYVATSFIQLVVLPADNYHPLIICLRSIFAGASFLPQRSRQRGVNARSLTAILVAWHIRNFIGPNLDRGSRYGIRFLDRWQFSLHFWLFGRFHVFF